MLRKLKVRLLYESIIIAFSGGIVIYLLLFPFPAHPVIGEVATISPGTSTVTPVAVSYLPLVLSSRPIPTPPPCPNFELGGHIQNTGFPYVYIMHYAGMTWAKVVMDYGTDAAPIIHAAHSKGFKVQITASGTPDMVTHPNFEQDFARWTAEIARSGADAIEVWREPNVDRSWQNGSIHPQNYTNLLCKAYVAIKNTNSNTFVISAAPVPTGFFGGCWTFGCDDRPWLEGLYSAGAAQCMDYLGAHYLVGATSPSARSGHPADPGDGYHAWYFLPQTEVYYQTFQGERQIFYTEMGYASQEGVPPFAEAFAWARDNTDAEQAAWLAEAVQLSIDTGMVRAMMVWNIDFERVGADPWDGYAIVRPDQLCPACEALHAILGPR